VCVILWGGGQQRNCDGRKKGGKAVCAEGMVVVVVVVETVGRSRSGAVDKTIGGTGDNGQHIDKNICHPNGQNN
jgi:hypothetical protein